MLNPFHKYGIESLDCQTPRDDLLRRSRILVVDDERPKIIDDLKAAHFSVDYRIDIKKEDMQLIETPLYDLLLLDFGNVGKDFGEDEGLSLLKHIKRVNPALFVVAYTSKSLGNRHADFFRISDAVLSKDAGIQESLEVIEKGLQKAWSTSNLWGGLLAVSGITPGSKIDKELQDLYVRGIFKPSKFEKLKQALYKTLTNDLAQKVGFAILGKLIEIGIHSHLTF